MSGCKCLRTCPLGWSEWYEEMDGGEQGANAVCAHCQRGFNTPVCSQGVKTGTLIDIPFSQYIHPHNPNLRIDPFYNNQNSTHKPYVHEKTSIQPEVNDAYPCLFIKSCCLHWIATQSSVLPLLSDLLTLPSTTCSCVNMGKSFKWNQVSPSFCSLKTCCGMQFSTWQEGRVQTDSAVLRVY